MNKKLLRRLSIALVAPLMMFAVACGSDDDGDAKAEPSQGAVDGGPVVVVGQAFDEAKIITELYAAVLENAGFQASVKNVETRDLYLSALEEGKEFQVAGEYLSSAAEGLNLQANGENAAEVGTADSAATFTKLNELAGPAKLTALKYSEAQSKNGYAVTKKFAEENGNITTLSQLAALGQDLGLAAAKDCKDRQGCGKGLTDVYGLKITKYLGTGFGGSGTEGALKGGEVQVGQFGTTDPNIATNDFVLLEDDKGLLAAENILPVVNTAWLTEHPQAKDALEALSSVLTTEDLSTLIGQVLNERAKPDEVAAAYLKDKGLIK